MLKRNKMLVAFMMVAVLCMSVGFAALTDELTADGTVSLKVVSEEGGEETEIGKQYDADVYFKSASTTEQSGVEVAVDSNDKDNIDITIGEAVYTEVGQTVTVTAVIVNDGEYAVTLDTPVVTDENIKTYFTTEANLETTTLESEKTATLTIKLTLEKIPAENIVEKGFSVKVVATPAE